MSSNVTGAGAVQVRRARPLNFDRLAHAYRWMEWFSFGPYLWRTRCAFLPGMTAACKALVLGDGDGRFTAALLRRNRQLRVDAVDVSEAMLRSLLRRAAADVGRVCTETCDVRDWRPNPGAGYDLVVTHFFLDCLTTDEVRALAERVRPCLAPGTMWVMSEFAIPDGAFGRLVARPVVGALYCAFGLLTGLAVRRLPDWRGALEAAGLVRVAERRRLRGLLVSEMWSVAAPTADSLRA
jgi:ubiquinone/menaquinone biosynthesis C-methylase UbiE